MMRDVIEVPMPCPGGPSLRTRGGGGRVHSGVVVDGDRRRGRVGLAGEYLAVLHVGL
jgi:hypothetical protein